MFVESKTEAKESWLEQRARRHPGVFVVVLVLMAAGVTVGLLSKAQTAVVLYQGF